MPITVLPEKVASQIAAGEVIERPASVVKELLENCLDAQATLITIQIEKGGRKLIEVSDNGIGIPPGELELAVARHATSKLHEAEDLFHIKTLGFRGEALASIGSVSRMTLISKIAENLEGAVMEVDGGRIKAMMPSAADKGTSVRVQDLFFNVPARLKFLKKDQTERLQIDSLVTRYALAYPNVKFHLIQDGKLILKTSGNGDRREVLANLFGVDIARQMLQVDLVESPMEISGYISPISLTRSNRKEITFFVNGRWIQDAALNAALLQAYHTLLMVGRYPISILLLTLPAEDVDVNVHPAKAEVRFHQTDRLFSLVQRAVRRSLLVNSPVPQVNAGYWRPIAQPVHQKDLWSTPAIAPSSNISDEITGSQESGTTPIGKDQEIASRLPILRLVGQVGATYLIAEAPDGLYLIDQHAAHERVLFEKYKRQHQSQIPSQSLLEPAILTLSHSAAEEFQGKLVTLSHLGFEIEPFGAGSFIIRSLPSILVGSDPQAAVRVVIEDFEEDETPLQNEIEDRIIARICKRAAIKAGKVLAADEQLALLRDLEACESPRTCPHGRPTMIHLSVDLLERQFGRRGSR